MLKGKRNWKAWGGPTEKLLATGALLNDLDQSRLELLDRRDVVGEEAHLSGLGGDVDLDDVVGGVDLLYVSHTLAIYSFFPLQVRLVSNACASPLSLNSNSQIHHG